MKAQELVNKHFEMLLEVQDKTHGNRVCNVKANAVLCTPIKTIEKVTDNTLGDTRKKVEAKTLDDTLA